MVQEVVLEIDEDAKVSVNAFNTIEDLWHDYKHFFSEALKLTSTEPAFEQKRYLRVSLVLFVAYCAGIVDRWCRHQLEQEGRISEDLEEWLRRTCLDQKCTYLYKRAKKVARTVVFNKPDLRFKRIRNTFIHASYGQDFDLFSSLTPSLLCKAEADMTAWLDVIGGVLGYERLPNTEQAVQIFDELGPVLHKASTKPKEA